MANSIPLSRSEDIIDNIESLCPICNSPVNAHILRRDGKIYQRFSCEEHGRIEYCVFSDARLYDKLDSWNSLVHDPAGGISENQPCFLKCDHCIDHRSPTMLAVIDITNYCNFKCPICFAESNHSDSEYFLSYDTIVRMLASLASETPNACRQVQFSGGEPTLHPRFQEIISAARDMGFDHIQVATNGSSFLKEDFVEACELAGLHTLYLQFDSMDDDVYIKLRGRKLLEDKIRIVDIIAKTNMRIVLVPMIMKGINEEQIGPIFDFALEYSKCITGLSYQPVAQIGRCIETDHAGEQFNLADLALEFGKQTGLTSCPEDWFPLNSIAMITRGLERLRGDEVTGPVCDAHCSLGTYFHVDSEGKATCISRFLDVEKFLESISRLTPKKIQGIFKQLISRYREWNDLKRFFKRVHAPKGLTFERMLRSLDGWEDKAVGRASNWDEYGFNGMFVAGMHFMDHRNFNIRRLRRCIIHYITADGYRIPFCNYNSGMRLRNKEEATHLE